MSSTSTLDIDRIIELTRKIAAEPPLDRHDLVAGLDAIRQVSCWLHARRLVWMRSLSACSPSPEHDIASASRTSIGYAYMRAEHARAVGAMPAFEAVLERGDTTTDHATAMASALVHADRIIGEQLYEHADELADLAANTTVEQFRRRLGNKIRRLQEDNAIPRRDRQKQATRLRAWTDKLTGMWHIHGQFDPESALAMRTVLDATLERLHGAAPPPTCPDDPVAKQDHLRALALVGLLTDEDRGASDVRTARAGVDLAVVLDLTKEAAEIDWGIDIDLPPSFLVDLIAKRDVTINGIFVANGVVVSAPGVLDQGRNNRLANRAQRRALRAMYASCAVPGCDVAFGHCKIHHIVSWTNDGLTDLINLLPLCVRHHTAVHTKDWLLHLTPDRMLTISDSTGRRICGPTGTNRHGRAS